MFKVVITEESTTMQGTLSERLTGLCCYIEALKEIGVSENLIRNSINIVLEDEKENSKVETILDNDEVKIQKINLSNMSKEEAKKLLDKLFD